MDAFLVDITVEFLSVAFHNILYYTSVYPKSIFETRRKYNVVVNRSTHPEVNKYIDLCLKTIAEYLKNEQLSRIEFSITDENYEPMINFLFDFERNLFYDEDTDSYLVQMEHNLRCFCLKLATLSDKFRSLPENLSFNLFLHTNESAAVSTATNPDLEDFPFVHVELKKEVSRKIFPLRKFAVRNYNLDTYIEIK